METKDTYWEHSQHDKYQEGCSTCWSENLRVEQSNADFKQEYYSSRPSDWSRSWDNNPLE